MYKAMYNVVKRVNMKRPALIAATFTATALDMQDVTSNKIEIAVGTITDGTHTPVLNESNDNATWTAVAAGNMVGALAALASNVDQSVSYIGSQRYVTVIMTVTGAPATGGVYGISAQVCYRKQN